METTLTSEVEPAPSKLGRRPESEPLNDEELAVRDEVLALLSPQSAADMRAPESLVFMTRILRGYWVGYEPRVGTIVDVLERCLVLRRRFDAPTLLRRELHPTFHRELWPTTLLGHDRYGHPVVYERLSDLQLDRVLREFTTDEVLALRMQAFEALQHVCDARSTRAGKPRVYKCVFLVDVSGASLSLLRPQARALMAAYSKLTEEVYSDCVWVNDIVNAPAVARVIWGAVSKMIDPITQECIKFLDADAAAVRAQLASAGVPDDVIPRELGGNAPPVPKRGETDHRSLAEVIERLRAAPDGDGSAPSTPPGRASMETIKAAAARTHAIPIAFDFDDDDDDDDDEDGQKPKSMLLRRISTLEMEKSELAQQVCWPGNRSMRGRKRQRERARALDFCVLSPAGANAATKVRSRPLVGIGHRRVCPLHTLRALLGGLAPISLAVQSPV